MSLAKLNIEQLFKSGAHFGHHSKRWNPKMEKYIYGTEKGIHIIDLNKTLEKTNEACKFVYGEALKGKNFFFIGTKRQAQEPIKKIIKDIEVFYTVERWLGGTLTNLNVIKQSVSYLEQLKSLREEEGFKQLKKKEISRHNREIEKKDHYLCGIADMRKLPDVVIIIDINKEKNALHEARKLKIPIIAFVDTNSNPALVDYPIPVNDDSSRAIKAIITLLAETIKKASSIYEKKKKVEERKEAENQAREAQAKIFAQKKAETKKKVEKQQEAQKKEEENQVKAKKKTEKKSTLKKKVENKETTNKDKKEISQKKKNESKESP